MEAISLLERINFNREDYMKFKNFVEELKKLKDNNKEIEPYFFPRLFSLRNNLTVKSIKYFLGIDNTDNNLLSKYLIDYEIKKNEIIIVLSANVFSMDGDKRILETIVFNIENKNKRRIYEQ